MPILSNLPALLLPAILCTVAATAPPAAEPPQDVDALVACMGSKNFTASDDCATALTELSRRDASVSADGRVHRAFAARVHRDIEDFREWQRAVAAMTEAEIERESPEYEDGTSTMLLADTIRFQLLPHAGPDTEPVLFEALLAAAVMNDDMERGIARYGQRAAGATLDFARSDQPDRRRIGYRVLGWMLALPAVDMLASPLDPSARDAAASAITAGLQEGEPSVRLAAIRAAQRGRVRGAFPMLRVLAVTLPDDDPHRLRQAAAEAVATLGR
jgi:hypothetical protein